MDSQKCLVTKKKIDTVQRAPKVQSMPCAPLYHPNPKINVNTLHQTQPSQIFFPFSSALELVPGTRPKHICTCPMSLLTSSSSSLLARGLQHQTQPLFLSPSTLNPRPLNPIPLLLLVSLCPLYTVKVKDLDVIQDILWKANRCGQRVV